MKYTLLLLPLLLLTGCSGARLEPSEASGVESRVLSNRYLRAEVVPDACGAVVSLQYRPTGTVLTEPFEYSVSKIDLLPDQVSANAAGSRTWLWKEKNMLSARFTVQRELNTPDLGEVVMSARYYQGTGVVLERRIQLERNSSELKLFLTFRNPGKSAVTVIPWENAVMQLNPERMDDVLLPVRGGVGRVGEYGVQRVENDRIFADDATVFSKEVKIAPARGWIARRNAGSPLILAIRTDMKNLQPDGFFYSWKMQGNSPVHTMEIIFTPFLLKPGAEKTFEVDYLVFQGLEDLKEICGDIGLDCRVTDSQINLSLCGVRPVAADTLSLVLKSSEGPEFSLGKINVPALNPGKAERLTFRLPPLSKGEYRILGKFGSGKEFTLLEPLVRSSRP